MRLSRRQLLLASTAGAATLALSGCKSFEQMAFPVSVGHDTLLARPRTDRESAARLLNRIGYGHRPGDWSAVQAIGTIAYVDQQLSPNTIVESAVLLARLRHFEDQLPNDYGLLYEIDDHQLISSLAQATLLRAVYSNRSLFERMVEFWSDHFNIFAFKSLGLPQYTVLFNQNVLRKHALGNFRTLLGECAQSAAILSYLDNNQNRAGRPNENYARELMELHTLGIDGGYCQTDVENVARCLTGWTFDHNLRPGSYQFIEKDHDTGDKILLNSPIRSRGKAEVEEVLDRLASHPSTARRIATKLLRRFRGDAMREHVDHVSSIYLSSDCDIKRTMRSVLVDCGLADAPPMLKRPFDFIASALRAMDVDTDCNPSFATYLSNMGQPLFEWPRPDGYTDKSTAWANCLSARWQFALDLASGKVSNTTIEWTSLAPSMSSREIISRLFTSSSQFQSATGLFHSNRSFTVQETAAIALMSPEFQWK